MKVVAFNGSPRKDGNMTTLIHHVFQELEKESIETKLVQLSGSGIHGCIACYRCFENKDRRCAVKDDIANECIEKMIQTEGIILGSPVYFTDVTSEMRNKGEVEKDEEGSQSVKILGQRIGWLLKKLYG
jgi:multimeric flavodoxin WrbA